MIWFKELLSKYRWSLCLAAIFILGEIIAWPEGEFPLNDDWAYAKSALSLHNSGSLVIGDWPAMSLITHLLYGVLFTKTFGFSFWVLRISTIISSLTGMLVLQHLIFKISNNRWAGLVAGLTLCFNPVYFNLSNTYMTDVNFNTLIIIGCLFVHNYFSCGFNRSAFIMVFVISALLVFLRQFGLVFPLAFMLVCLISRKVKWHHKAAATIVTVFLVFLMHQYDSYVKTTLSPYSNYQLIWTRIAQPDFINEVAANIPIRCTQVILHILLYLCPFSVLYFTTLISQCRILHGMLVIVLSCLLSWLLFHNVKFPLGNIFIDTGVGPETYYESIGPVWKDNSAHSQNEYFQKICGLIKVLLPAISLSVIFLFLVKNLSDKKIHLRMGQLMPFLLVFSGIYTLLVFIPSSYGDRYNLPVITTGAMLFSFIKLSQIKGKWISVILILSFMYVSVAGTRDYFEMNRVKWRAYNHLLQLQGIKAKEINAGFEAVQWNNGEYIIWYHFFELKNFNYLVQYRNEDGFTPIRKFPFRCYFPPGTDTISIFQRTRKIDSVQVIGKEKEIK